MPQGQVETLHQTGADLSPRAASRAPTEALVKRVQAASLLVDRLRIDPLMGFQHGFAGASAVARARQLLDWVVDRVEPRASNGSSPH
jgi:hypothetical protein